MPGEWMPILRFVCIVLVPVIPAYLLFKAIPSRADTTGHLQGMEVKLGGAFAGYFALLLLIGVDYQRLFPAPVLYQVWELSGKVTDETGKPIPALNAENIHLSPPSVQTYPDGTFNLTFVTIPGRTGKFAFPTLSVQAGDFFAPTISLDRPQAGAGGQPIQIERDDVGQNINIPRIPLSQNAAYNPNAGAAPKPLTQEGAALSPAPQAGAVPQPAPQLGAAPRPALQGGGAAQPLPQGTNGQAP